MENKLKILIIEEGFLRKDIENFLNTKSFDAKLISVNSNIADRKKTSVDKFLNIFYRVFFKNTFYYQNRNINHKNKFYLKEIKNKIKIEHFDVVLLIVPYHYSYKLVSFLSRYSNKIVGYAWESINNEKENQLEKILDFFEDIYCFNKASINNYINLKLKYTTNFYYPIAEIETLKKEVKQQKLISYVGNLADRRDLKIEYILDNIGTDIKTNIKIVTHKFNKSTLSQKYNFDYIDDGISLNEYLKITLNSSIVLDIQVGWQNGFSFRIIEASYLEKKVITTNQNAYELKFYHPNNIFIFNEETKHLLNDFIHKPFVKIEKDLIEYYRVDNWLNRILKLS